MGEVLFWTMTVFAVLGLPPLIAVLWELRRERKAAEQQERQRRFDKEQMRQREQAPGSSSSTGVWPGMFLAAWTL